MGGLGNLRDVFLLSPDPKAGTLDALLNMIADIAGRIANLGQTEAGNLHDTAHFALCSVDPLGDFAESFREGF